VRFLVDEMFGPDLAVALEALQHQADHVRALGLAGVEDRDVLARAVEDGSVVVTENAADFIPLLDARIASGLAATAVVIVLKANLPAGAGALHHALAKQLSAWADQHPDPYRHVHWLA
jgi:predicted nuclease of predicted toxin-antitoxin system